ncbi:toll-like receptor 7 [Contarinia nasturtii]|uniref:toll-like receptor 7 n=1 Tax=Contarinia nasturtii TaxID=265458 RepID=UPI0012D47387|nr:toll-like receptor 7 [Contarinia nasturtii]
MFVSVNLSGILILFIVLQVDNIRCKSITVECDKNQQNYCSIVPSSIDLPVENTFYFINPNYYLHAMETILEIRPYQTSNIVSIDSIFDYFPKLEQLIISNSLNKIPFMRAASQTLQLVNFRQNFIKNITKFAFDGAPNLERIDLSSNSIRSIENQAFAKLDRLTSIRLENNKLGSLHSHTFVGAKSLVYINLRNNYITTIANGCFALKYLNELILAENRLDIIPDTIFNGAENLKKISFAHNKIKVIDVIAVAQSAPIEMLNFEDNELAWFEKQSINCTETPNNQLKNLNLAKNKLKSGNILDRLKCLQRIEMLNLNSNDFTTFENISDLRIYFPHLSVIYLINNKIQCDWLKNTAFDTSLIYTRSNRRKLTVHNIECL